MKWRRLPTVLGVFLVAVGAVVLVVGASVPNQDAPEPAPFASAAAPSRVPPPPAGLPANTLVVSDLGISAPLTPGTVSAHSLEIPSNPAEAALWVDGGQPCGSKGTVLIAGHVSSYGTKGALWSLHDVVPGTVAVVTCADGTATSWYASRVIVVPKDQLPQDVFNSVGRPRMAVVTCGGPLLPTGHYRDNVVVWFERLP